MKYYKCHNCGNIVIKIENSQMPLICCKKEMNELPLENGDASLEKHMPNIVCQDGCVTVTIGEIEHPMMLEHRIKWIALETERNFMIEYLKPGDQPIAIFKTDYTIKSIYSYCNLHGLWKKDMEKN